MEILPAAPKRFSVGIQARVLEPGTELWRIYSRGGRYPSAWNGFRFDGPTTSRFDHHTNPKRKQKRGILYATTGAQAFLTALAESFQDTRLIDRKRHDPWIASFRLPSRVTLLDTSSTWPVRAGGSMAINSGSRSRAREWSRAIYRNYAKVEGIWYPSSLTNFPCVAIYERAISKLPSAPTFNESLASPKLFAGLTNLANGLNYALR